MDLPDLFPANPMQLRTIRHYNFSEVSSAMQKAIRRGDAALAGLPGSTVFTPSTCAAVTVRMLLIRLKSAWSWSRITWDSSGEFGRGSEGS